MALQSFRDDSRFWSTLGSVDAIDQVGDLEPADRVILADEERLDGVAEAFARVVDAKSPYTARHSEGVANIAVGIARAMGLRRTIRPRCIAPACCTTSANSASRT